jgi:formate dehydrogenase major subunit
MTNHWNDIKNADLVLIMGGNAAAAHPCGFKYVTEAMQTRNAKLVVVDPRFTQSAAVADYYAPLRPGTDIAFLGGVINYLIANDRIHWDYVKAYTNVGYVLREDYRFEDGLFSGYDAEKRSYDRATWQYELGQDGYAVVDETLQHPRCVWQLMKAHYERYTPEVVNRICGTPKEQFLKVCEEIAATASAGKVMTIMYALGWTQHSHGSQNIRTMAMIQLLLGNVGRPGGGINALRGHTNVQGATDMCPFGANLPGYLAAPSEGHTDLATFLEKTTPKALRPNSVNFKQNTPKWVVSLLKAWYGSAATKDNDFAYDWLPKYNGAWDSVAIFERMVQGKVTGLISQGYNPLFFLPNVRKSIAALSKLKFLVVIDPMKTETSEFWRGHGDVYKVDPSTIQTEVFRLPANLFAEDDGTFTNSGRVITWHYAGQQPPGEGRNDLEILGLLYTRIREMYRTEGGRFPEPILNLTWPYAKPTWPSPDEILQEVNGRALVDLTDPKDPTRVLLKAGERLPGFGLLRDDGSTACGNWIYSGVYPQAGNFSKRTDGADPSGMGNTLGWGFAWPANRRVLYNRANLDPASGKPWDGARPLVAWNGKAWVGNDIVDYPAAAGPETGGPFIMNPEGVARLFSPDMPDGPFPEHYEPFETPVGGNLLHQNVVSNPAARLYGKDKELFGRPDEYPYAATTYRLPEHYHAWTKNSLASAILAPRQFVEIGEDLAKEKGLKHGDTVRVSSPRGHIECAVSVTKRFRALDCDGRKVHTVGIPIHWGFMGVTKPGFMINLLTPVVADAVSQTPEYKAFLVNVEKA